MTRSGAAYIQGLEDGRSVFIDGERVHDVVTHPAFADAVQSVANLYDIANDPSNRELMTFPSPKTGEPVNRVFMIPRDQEDLRLRRSAIRRWSEATFGMMGRSPDHVAGFLAGFASAPEIFARGPGPSSTSRPRTCSATTRHRSATPPSCTSSAAWPDGSPR